MVQFTVHLTIHLELHLKVHFKGLYKGAQKSCTSGALELYLLRQFSIHKTVQYDSVKRETAVTLYATLESAPKISFWGALKTP